MEIREVWPFGKHAEADAEGDSNGSVPTGSADPANALSSQTGSDPEPVALSSEPVPPPAAPPAPPASPPAPAAEQEPTSAAAAAQSVDQVDAELAARRAEIARMEEMALREVESMRIRQADLERREQAMSDRERNIDQRLEDLNRQKKVLRKELEELSGLSAAQAEQLLIAEVAGDAKRKAGAELRKVDEELRRDADRRARNILSVAMQRLAAPHTGETTTRVVELPDDKWKGRIIGAKGRNIQALERLTGVDIGIDDELDSAVTLSSFDGVRREVARVTLERLIEDGRVHPASCEEAYEWARERVESEIIEYAEQAAAEAGVHGLDHELMEVLGKLKFRTSYGQNVLDHLVECAQLAALIAAELGASIEIARRGAFLHDIGKAVTHEVEGPHAAVGATLVRRHGESEAVAHAVAAHHNEVDIASIEAMVVQTADSISGSRPGARGASLEQYVARMRDLEEIAARDPGVEEVLVMKAGREIRVVVDPGKVDDDSAVTLAHKVADELKAELDFPGRIDVVVIREMRASAHADATPPAKRAE